MSWFPPPYFWQRDFYTRRHKIALALAFVAGAVVGTLWVIVDEVWL